MNLRITNWINSKSENKYLAQKEYVLNVILVGLIFLFGFLTVLSFFYWWHYGQMHTGESPIYVGLTWLGFMAVFFLSKNGRTKLAGWFLFIIFLVFANVVSIKSGAESPISLLLFAWVFTLIGIIFERKIALGLYLTSAGNIMLITYLQIGKWILPDLHWKTETLDLGISFSHVLILLIIALIASLYNREITKSLTRALCSEDELRKERDLLEIRVAERTEDLRKAQLEEIKNLRRFAQFGQNMSGLIHDLTNPLTAIALNLSQLKDHPDHKGLAEVKKYSTNAIRATDKMADLIRSTRQKLKKKTIRELFPVKKRILNLIKLWNLQLKNQGVNIKLKCPKKLNIVGDPSGFDQIISNLVSNSIDAYQKISQMTKTVMIEVFDHRRTVEVIVSDQAGGISEKNLENIFKPFFSTKHGGSNQGIGLYIIKNMIETDFGGTINVKTKDGSGTKFIVSLPTKL